MGPSGAANDPAGAVGELAAQGRCDSKERVSFCLGIDFVKNWHPIPN